MGAQGVRMRHHLGREVQRKLANARRNLARRLLEEAGLDIVVWNGTAKQKLMTSMTSGLSRLQTTQTSRSATISRSLETSTLLYLPTRR